MAVPTPAITSYTGPGDIVPSAAGWWGLRAYSAAQAGTVAVRLRRDSDNVESDFNTLPTGILDVASITTFKGAANLFVTTLYDQSGGTTNLVQATAANQPKFILSAIGSRPAMQDNGASTTLMQSSANFTFTTPFTFSTVYEVTSVVDGMIVIGSTAFPQVRVGTAPNSIVINGISAGITATAADSAWHALQGVFNGAVASDANVDGVSLTGDTSGDEPAQKLDMFAFSGGSNRMSGYITEVGWWSSAFSGANSSSMSANQHTYWGF